MEANKLITIVILLIISLVVMFLFVIPKYQESSALQQDLVQAQLQYGNQADYYQSVSKTLSSIKSKQDSLDKMNSALPSSPALAPVVSFLQKKEVGEVYITGGTANLPGLKDFLTKNLKKNVSIPNCFTGISYASSLAKTLAQMSPRFSAAVGVALGRLEG